MYKFQALLGVMLTFAIPQLHSQDAGLAAFGDLYRSSLQRYGVVGSSILVINNAQFIPRHVW